MMNRVYTEGILAESREKEQTGEMGWDGLESERRVSSSFYAGAAV